MSYQSDFARKYVAQGRLSRRVAQRVQHRVRVQFGTVLVALPHHRSRDHRGHSDVLAAWLSSVRQHRQHRELGP